MVRTQQQEETTRQNYMIFKSQDKALRKLTAKEPVDGGMSGHVRLALDMYLKLDKKDRVHYIPKDIQNIIILIDYMIIKTPKIKGATEYELAKGDLMLMFGKEWYKMKGVVDMTISAFRMKKVDVLDEVMTIELERSKEKYGFRLCFPTKMTRDSLNNFKKRIIEDVTGYGRIRPVDGDK